jgi:ribosome-binding protein aMBF1 (putative translation factor)
MLPLARSFAAFVWTTLRFADSPLVSARPLRHERTCNRPAGTRTGNGRAGLIVEQANEALGALIRRSRQRVPYSQGELAARVGITARAVQEHEAGRRIPRPAALRGYARVLGIEPETFYRLAHAAHEQRDHGREPKS